MPKEEGSRVIPTPILDVPPPSSPGALVPGDAPSKASSPAEGSGNATSIPTICAPSASRLTSPGRPACQGSIPLESIPSSLRATAAEFIPVTAPARTLMHDAESVCEDQPRHPSVFDSRASASVRMPAPRHGDQADAFGASPSRRRVAIFFSGRRRVADLRAAYERRGFEVHTFELRDGQDLLDTSLVDEQIAQILGGFYDFIFLCPPCSSFSIDLDVVLRTVSEPDGVADMPPEWRAYVDKGNRLLCVAVRLAWAAHCVGVGWLFEHPASRHSGPGRWPKFADRASAWDTLPITRLHAGTGAVKHDLAFCAYGSEYQKWTTMMGVCRARRDGRAHANAPAIFRGQPHRRVCR